MPSLKILKRKIHCPPEMVAVAGRVCVDRYEGSLVSKKEGLLLSPYYPPEYPKARRGFRLWEARRKKSPFGTLARHLPLPPLPPFQTKAFTAVAKSKKGATPNGYTSGYEAAAACKAAGKRLCSEAEWVTACRGENNSKYPYGHNYRQNRCNVFREAHPARILHHGFSIGHSDPRLNQLEYAARPLLKKTGETRQCKSVWGKDAIYDMVGNLDEWVDDKSGLFVGGFYARSTRNGCDARVSNHAFDYFDYSTGVRCCRDPLP